MISASHMPQYLLHIYRILASDLFTLYMNKAYLQVSVPDLY